MLAVLGSLFLKEKRARERGGSLKAELCVVWMTLFNLQIFSRSVGFSALATGVTSQCATPAFRARWASLPCGHTFFKKRGCCLLHPFINHVWLRFSIAGTFVPLSVLFLECLLSSAWSTMEYRPCEEGHKINIGAITAAVTSETNHETPSRSMCRGHSGNTVLRYRQWICSFYWYKGLESIHMRMYLFLNAFSWQ